MDSPFTPKTTLIESRGAFNTIFWCVIALLVFFYILRPLLDRGLLAAGLFAKTAGEPKPTSEKPAA